MGPRGGLSFSTLARRPLLGGRIFVRRGGAVGRVSSEDDGHADVAVGGRGHERRVALHERVVVDGRDLELAAALREAAGHVHVAVADAVGEARVQRWRRRVRPLLQLLHLGLERLVQREDLRWVFIVWGVSGGPFLSPRRRETARRATASACTPSPRHEYGTPVKTRPCASAAEDWSPAASARGAASASAAAASASRSAAADQPPPRRGAAAPARQAPGGRRSQRERVGAGRRRRELGRRRVARRRGAPPERELGAAVDEALEEAARRGGGVAAPARAGVVRAQRRLDGVVVRGPGPHSAEPEREPTVRLAAREAQREGSQRQHQRALAAVLYASKKRCRRRNPRALELGPQSIASDLSLACLRLHSLGAHSGGCSKQRLLVGVSRKGAN